MNMSSNTSIRGVLPAIVTPLDSDGAFAPQAMEGLLERVYLHGAHGVYALGQTGEGLQTPLAVRKQAAEVVLKNTPAGKCTIIHVGSSCLEDAIDLASHAARSGASAISSLPPAGGLSFADIRSFYERLAAASDIPLLVYYFPEIAPAISSLDQILDLCSLPNVAGLKFTGFDLFALSRISLAGHAIFNGRDEVFAAGMLMGAHGGIGSFYNLAPQMFVRVYGCAAAGNWTEARSVQDRINELIAITIRFPLFAAIKTLLRWSGIDCGPCRAPRLALTPEQESDLRRQLESAGFDPSGFLK
jgi:N-acetylneuraminate lyase